MKARGTKLVTAVVVLLWIVPTVGLLVTALRPGPCIGLRLSGDGVESKPRRYGCLPVQLDR